jgi:hypothetical protein
MAGHERGLVAAACVAIASLVACAGAGPGTANSKDPSSSASPKPESSSDRTADLAAKTAAENAKANKNAGGDESSAPEWTSHTGFNPKEWMKAHQATGAGPKEAQCEAAQVRAPTIDAISCDKKREVQIAQPVQIKGDEAPYVIPPKMMFYRMIYVMSENMLRKVLEIPIEAGPLNPVTKDPDANAYARLQVELDSEGTKLSVTDDPNFSCDRAMQKHAEMAADKDLAEAAKWLKKAIDPVCASRGDYAWRNGSFARISGKKNKKK